MFVSAVRPERKVQKEHGMYRTVHRAAKVCVTLPGPSCLHRQHACSVGAARCMSMLADANLARSVKHKVC